MSKISIKKKKNVIYLEQQKKDARYLYLLKDLYAFLMTKHANESLHPNYPKYQYNNKTTHSISKSYDSMQLTVKHFLQV